MLIPIHLQVKNQLQSVGVPLKILMEHHLNLEEELLKNMQINY